MKTNNIKNIVIIVLSVLLVMSVFTQTLCFSLLGINNVESFKHVMLAGESVNNSGYNEPAPEIVNKSEAVTTATEPTVEATIATEATQPNASTVILDSKGIKVTYLGNEYDDFWKSYKMKFAVENNSDVDVTVVSKDMVIDGFMVEYGISLYCEVLAGKKAVESMTLYAFELEPLGIEKPNTVEFKLAVNDSNEVFKDITNSDNITINLT